MVVNIRLSLSLVKLCSRFVINQEGFPTTVPHVSHMRNLEKGIFLLKGSFLVYSEKSCESDRSCTLLKFCTGEFFGLLDNIIFASSEISLNGSEEKDIASVEGSKIGDSQ